MTINYYHGSKNKMEVDDYFYKLAVIITEPEVVRLLKSD